MLTTGRSRALLRRSLCVVLAVYAVLVPAAAFLATRIPSQGAIDRLIVPSDPDYAATRAFQAIFPESQLVLLVVRGAGSLVARHARARRALRGRARRRAARHGVLGARRAPARAAGRGRRDAAPARQRDRASSAARAWSATDFLTVLVDLDVHGADERDAALAAIDAAVARAAIGPVHEVGAPVVNAWLERAVGGGDLALVRDLRGAASSAITWFLYRSLRALLAIVLALGATVALARRRRRAARLLVHDRVDAGAAHGHGDDAGDADLPALAVRRPARRA